MLLLFLLLLLFFFFFFFLVVVVVVVVVVGGGGSAYVQFQSKSVSVCHFREYRSCHRDAFWPPSRRDQSDTDLYRTCRPSYP